MTPIGQMPIQSKYYEYYVVLLGPLLIEKFCIKIFVSKMVLYEHKNGCVPILWNNSKYA